MYYQDSSHNSIDEELLSYFKMHPYSLLDRNHINGVFGKEMHNHLVRLEKEKFILRSKIKVRDKPVTQWQLNGKFDTKPELERHRSSNNYQVSKRIHETDNLFIEVMKGNEFYNPRSVSFTKPKPNDNNWERGKYSSRQKSWDLPEKIDRIESDSQIDELTYTKFAQLQLNQHPPAIKREENVMNKFESDSLRSYHTFTNISQSQQIPNSLEFKPEENIMGNIVSDSVKYERKFTKIPQSKLNPNSPEFKPQSFRNSNDENTENTEHSDPSSQMLNNLSLEFMTALTKNPVCVLHEFCQQRGMICEFKIVEMQGPSHKPRISTAVFVNGKMYDTVVTSNKKEGKRKAADLAIRNLISEGYFATKLNRSIQSDNGDKIMKIKEFSNRNFEKFDNSSAMYDHMASLVYNKLAEIVKGLSPNQGLSLAGRKVVSAIIMQNEKFNTYEVVSLATGNRCITGDKLSLQGSIINDSHAEIIARRSFLYFLYKQLNACLLGISKPMNLFDEIWSNQNSMNPKRYFKVKDDFKFHLYISTAPCGDGALFCSKETTNKTDRTNAILSNDHEPIFENHSQGLLRTKIEGGEGTIPVPVSIDCCYIQTLDGILHGERLRTMSCSDKIARWNYLGIQGALLEIFIQPIFLKSIMLGNLFNAGHLSRAVCCRLEKFQLSPLSGLCKVNHPDLVNVYIGELHREIDKSNELSINWCYGEHAELVDGVTGELSMKKQINSTKSRLCKASLFREFHQIYKMLQYQLCISHLTYSEVKSLSRSYDDKKKALYLKFHCAKYGSWVCKPIEQSQFKNILTI